MADMPPTVEIERGSSSGLSRFSIIWVIPIIALLAALGVAWKTYNDRGPIIEIEFKNGAGIAKRETELRYRDITVGVVEDIDFSDGLEAVIVSVRVDKKVAPYIDAAAKFWVVRPELTTQGISGLETVLSGVYIEGSWDSEISPAAYRFKGLSDPPLFKTGQEGLQIAFRTTPGGDLIDNSPITYRGIEVGRVGKAQISRQGNFAIAEAIIYEDHKDLVNASTRFWNTSGFTFSVGPQGADIDFSSLATLIAGGVTFETFVSGGDPVSDGDVFDVYADEGTARNSLFNPSEVETLKMRVIFNDNISGLAVGAPVELAGLRIGKVESVSGVIDQDAFGDSRVRLSALLAIQPARLGLQGDVTPETALAFLANRVEDGLRARLTSASLLTGGLKIELIQVDDADPVQLATNTEAPPIIPTTDSDITDAAATVEGVFNRINNLPVEELLQSAIDFLDSAEALVSSDDIRAVPKDVRALLTELREIAESDEVQAIPANVNAAVARFETLMTQLEKEEFTRKLVAAVEAAGEAAGAVSSSVEGMPAVVAQIEALAAKAEALPLEDLTAEFTALVKSADAIIKTDEAKQLPADLSAALNEVNATLAEFREGGAVENLNTTLASARKAADSVAGSVEDLPNLIKRAERILVQASSTIAGYDKGETLSREAQGALRDISKAADALASLARMLERNPSLLLRGR